MFFYSGAIPQPSGHIYAHTHTLYFYAYIMQVITSLDKPQNPLFVMHLMYTHFCYMPLKLDFKINIKKQQTLVYHMKNKQLQRKVQEHSVVC